MSTIQEPQGTHIGITFGMLVDPTGQRSLPSLKSLSEKRIKEAGLIFKYEKSRRTCMSIVLGVLAVLAATQCMILLAHSGFPTNIDPQLFIPGVLLGITALGCVTGEKMFFSRSQSRCEVQNKEVKNMPVQALSNERTLEAMQRRETAEEDILFGMKNFKENQRRAEFMQWTQEQYFGGEKPKELTAANRKVLNVFAQFPDELNEMDFETVDRKFALYMLGHMDPATISGEDEIKRKELFEKLFIKVGPPQNANEVKIYANYPVAVAWIAQKAPDQFSEEAVAAIYAVMDSGQTIYSNQRAALLKQLANDRDALIADQGQNAIETKEPIAAIAYICIAQTLTKEFANLFSIKKEEASEEEKILIEKAYILLTEVARWPAQASKRIYLEKKDTRFDDASMITAIYLCMQKKEQEQFIDTAAQGMLFGKQDGSFQAMWINKYAKDGNLLPEPTLKIFAHTPTLMGMAMSRLHDGRSILMANTILNLMTRKNKLLCLETDINIVTTLLQAHRAKVIPMDKNSPVVVYFKEKPAEFKEFVLDNKKLGDEKVRATLALDILENMGRKAEGVISIVDKGGNPPYEYAFFTCLTNTLIDQVNSLKLEGVNNSRAKLIARFKWAPQMDKAKDDWVLGPKTIWNFRNVDWSKFDQVAERNDQQSKVWKKKPNK